MPVKFACPKCKNVMTVDDKFAGKKGKCNKCGETVTVPVPKTSTAPTANVPAGAAGAAGQPPAAQLNTAPMPSAGKIAAAGSLGHVLDELTESDYNRHSPFQAVYAPPKPKAEKHAMLDKAASQEEGSKKSTAKPAGGKGVLTWTLIFFGVLDILEAVLMYGAAVALAVVGLTMLDKIKDQIPMLGAGLAVFIGIIGLMATLAMAAGLGIFSKQVWGYCIAAGVYCFNLGLRLVAFLVNITNTDALMSNGVPLLLTIGFTSYLFRRECLDVYGIAKGSKLPWIAGGVGMLVALVMGGILFALGAFTLAAQSQ